MNDQVMRMAIECQLLNTVNREGVYADTLQKFADLVRANEREVCAKDADWCIQNHLEHLIPERIRARSTT